MRMRAFSSMHAAGEQAAAARAGEMVKVLLALGLWFLTVGCQQCQALAFPGHSRQYTVRLEGNDLVIGISCCSTLCKCQLPSQTMPAMVEVQPLVHVSTCPMPPSQEPWVSANISHSLLAAAQKVHLEEEDYNYWRLELPEHFQGVRCIDVHVEGSITGPGPAIVETRTKLWRELPELSVVNQEATVCASEQESCEVLDTSSYVTTVVLIMNGMRYFVEYLESEHRTVLPRFAAIRDQVLGYNCTPCWILVEENATEGENHVLFTPSRVFAVSKNEMYITGNGLLYSPNRGDTFYQLLLPHQEYQIGSIAFSQDKTFAFTILNSESVAIWTGFTGTADILQVFPSELTQRIRERCNFTWDDSMLRNATLSFDSQEDLEIMVGEMVSVKFPLPLLVSSAALYMHHDMNISHLGLPLGLPAVNYTQHPLAFSNNGGLYHEQLTSASHNLLMSSRSCPFVGMHVEATSCGTITRSKLQVVKEGALKWISELSLAENNCNISAHLLPKDIFLGKSASYKFLVHFVINPFILDPSNFCFAAKVSDPDVLAVKMSESFHSTNSTLTYKVTLWEQQRFSGQFESGYTATTVDVDFQVWGAASKCVDPLSDHLKQPGHLHTRVHASCPPGLSLAFDAEMTSERQSTQYCQPDNDISCYYFDHEFYPIFQIIDSVTEEHTIYKELYTLRAIAGGTGPTKMQYFNQSIEPSIWAPMNDTKTDNIYHYGDNGIKWVCGTSSPCGEVMPTGRGVPEYFLLLEASNRGVGENSTYCDFTVYFLIRIHGMGMGSITVIVTLLCILVVFVAVTFCLFALWHFKVKVLYLKDITEEAGRKMVNRVVEQIRRVYHS